MTTRLRLSPFLLTTAALALATLAPAQDRSRDGGHDRGRTSSHSDHPSRSRADRDRRSRDDRSSPSTPSRSDRGTPPDRGGDRTNPFNGDSNRRDDRTTGGGTVRRDDRGGLNGRPGGIAPAPNPRGRAVLGLPVHDRRPDYWDGRGHAPAGRFGPPPVHNALSIAIGTGGPYRGTEVAVGTQIGGLRVGFVSYSAPSYRRGYGYGPGPAFGYPYYAYDPYVPGGAFVASPWYRYSYLPPYLDRSHVITVDDYPSWNWDDWRRYDLDRDRDNRPVRDTVDDLRDAFEEQSTRIANRLVPEEGDVAIFNNGKYDYSLNPDDFQKMFLDGVEQSKTIRYEVEEVRTRGDEIRIRARHEYEDSWGKEQSVVHTITLRRENGGDYVIREFGSE